MDAGSRHRQAGVEDIERADDARELESGHGSLELQTECGEAAVHVFPADGPVDLRQQRGSSLGKARLRLAGQFGGELYAGASLGGGSEFYRAAEAELQHRTV